MVYLNTSAGAVRGAHHGANICCGFVGHVVRVCGIHVEQWPRDTRYAVQTSVLTQEGTPETETCNFVTHDGIPTPETVKCWMLLGG